VAESSGLAVSTISKAERGQIALSYEKVLMLGNALDIDDTAVHGRGRPAGGRRHAHRGQDCFEDVQRYETDQYLYSVLCGAFGQKMQPLVAVINAREAGEFSETIRHAGQVRDGAFGPGAHPVRARRSVALERHRAAISTAAWAMCMWPEPPAGASRLGLR
jgi:transcriptional regulator with XRE-family HTH domain